jgi:UDP-glucose 4-epimerase
MMVQPEEYFAKNLLDACNQFGVDKFVFSTTATSHGIPVKVPLTENYPQRSINHYGESKLMFEKMLRWYEEIHGLKALIF